MYTGSRFAESLELTLEKDASLGGRSEVRARAIGTRESTAGRQLVTVRCQLTSQFGTAAVFSVETEGTAEVPVDSTPLDGTTDSIATSDPDRECVDNITRRGGRRRRGGTRSAAGYRDGAA
jgi:hypothetical protein